jgi:hypothetical protein
MIALLAYFAIGGGLLAFAMVCDQDNELTGDDKFFTVVAWPLVLLTAVRVAIMVLKHRGDR